MAEENEHPSPPSPHSRAEGRACCPVSVGVDIVEIERVAGLLLRHGERFLTRVFTEAELAYCRERTPELAARFAGKEAILKALGTGRIGVGWREVEILPDRSGKPQVHLHGGARRVAADLALDHFAISLSHSRAFAVASVVAVGA
ncbi:MAG: holo-ACP synthase [Chloroflexota bacterium]